MSMKKYSYYLCDYTKIARDGYAPSPSRPEKANGVIVAETAYKAAARLFQGDAPFYYSGSYAAQQYSYVTADVLKTVKLYVQKEVDL